MLHAPLPSGAVQTARCAPLTATAPQPAIGAPFAVKATVPLPTTGLPSTVAVSETIPAAGDGFTALVTLVIVATVPPPPEFTACDKGALADSALLALPAYDATIECAPDANADVVHAAVRALPLPDKLTAVQPLIAPPSDVKATLPVGALPLTVAVNVTLAPEVDGFCELASVVVVATGAPAFTVCDSAVLDEIAFDASPA